MQEQEQEQQQQKAESYVFHSRCGAVVLSRDKWGAFVNFRLKPGEYRLALLSGGCPNRTLFEVQIEIGADSKQEVVRLPRQVGSIDSLFVRLLRRKRRPAGG